MQGIRKNLAGSGIFAALFFAVFAILVSFHHHDSSAKETPTHHCAVCQNASSSKVTASRPAAFSAPEISFVYLSADEISQTFIEAGPGNDPIRGPPLA